MQKKRGQSYHIEGIVFTLDTFNLNYSQNYERINCKNQRILQNDSIHLPQGSCDNVWHILMNALMLFCQFFNKVWKSKACNVVFFVVDFALLCNFFCSFFV